jgi:hypothetical protein
MNATLFTASKAAVNAFSESFALEVQQLPQLMRFSADEQVLLRGPEGTLELVPRHRP